MGSQVWWGVHGVAIRVARGRNGARLIALCLAAVVAWPAAVSACAGDCDGDATVNIAELTRGVAIALGLRPLGDCERFDVDGSGSVEIGELIVCEDGEF